MPPLYLPVALSPPVATPAPIAVTMKPKGFLGRLPGIRWTPHDIPSSESSSSTKPKSRIPFLLKSSAPGHATPRPRKSTISLTSESDVEIDARTHAQDQSLFFARLPIELRRMVYEYVMGAEVVHLTLSTKRRFAHFVCDSEEEHEVGKQCGCRVLIGGKKGARLDVGGVSMARACRRMYSEAIPQLYRAQTFSLLHITHLLYLPSSIPQPRLNSIRTLHLRWAIRALPYLRRGPSSRVAYREDTENWEKGWRIIAGMQRLRNLYVVLVDPSPQQMWERNWLELEDILLEAVRGVQKPNDAVVVLPYPTCGVDWDMRDSCVRLRRPEDGVVLEGDGE
ncbi:hypothetical protein TW65_07781 [Stemphylium lycopersici]|uniref:DUF7730 domain-containing protein n=1 Tax=Stemphylium lycopersici TaxID=183478 RepID=A0A364N8R1_STELY|nr:hypothetical protein TW65_07781 [Stemphylium lycopersici]RAR13421.1 hypothetical protein DDE83_003152 [Stemphylium lycopersici]